MKSGGFLRSIGELIGGAIFIALVLLIVVAPVAAVVKWSVLYLLGVN